MARFQETRAFIAGTDLAAKLLVKLSTLAVIANTAAATDDPIGVTEVNVLSGNPVAINFIGMPDDSVELTASGAFAAGVDVFAAAGGKVQALPVGAGTYRRVGKSLEAATADGDIVEILPYNDGKTVTV
jgi:hypothetical protein